VELTPSLILAMWVGGMAAGSAIVTSWKVVGPGYVWLTGSVVAGFGVVTAFAGGGTAGYVGAAAALVAVVVARVQRAAFLAFVSTTVCFLVVALHDSPALPAASGLAFLGAVTSEMILGHWFLVDPKLPRWPLFALAAMAAGFLAVEVVQVVFGGWLDLGGSDGVFGLSYLALSVFTALLIAGVWFSLREPRYSGVMAATGLSYLAVLTAFGVVTLGRALVTGGLT
jgi:hypothetical protein